MAATTGKLNDKGFRDNFDYSEALQKSDLSSSERAQLEKERQAKINDKYKGVEPNMTDSDKTYSQIYGSSGGSSSSSKSYTTSSSDSSYTKPTSGGTSGYTVTTYTPAASTDYHQQAIDAAARGDWDAVSRALADRQAKIDQQGGNDRGTSNTQILAQLRSQYGSSFDQLSPGRQDYVSLNAGVKLPYTTSYGATGTVYKDKGWQEGRDYLNDAQRLASAGDLDGAYDALMRRGFKMADTGATGNGITQDQAYAMIHQLYSQSDVAKSQYLNEVDINRQRLQEHQTQFGLQTIPALANRQLLSTDGKYWIIYDANGNPSVTRPNNGASRKYSDQEIALMSQYYTPGGAENFSELDRQLHNLGVVATGVGRLVDQQGNYASGAAIQPVTANDWTGLQQTDRYQDRAALQAILDQINGGTAYTGGSVTVPTVDVPQTYAPVSGGYGSSYGSYGGASGGYGESDLTAYLRQMYQANLDAQLAQLQAAYEQNLASSRAHDDLIVQNYLSQRNQAAAQNDLQRMYMNEMGVAQGLNTGTAGQMALALGSDLQNSLAMLGSAEARDLSESDLARQQLGIGYRGDVVSATAQSSSGLAGALYSEYVRQIEAAREEARWQAQMAYQQQQDALAQANWERQFQYNQQADRQSEAYKLAASMLQSGLMPDSATLAAAGISQSDAASLVQAYRVAVPQSTKKSAGGNSGSGNTTVGETSSPVSGGDGGGMNESYFNAMGRSIATSLEQGKTENLESALKSVWGNLSEKQRGSIQELLGRYHYRYEE